MRVDERKIFATTKEDLRQVTADVPVVMQRQVPVSQRVQRTVDIPRTLTRKNDDLRWLRPDGETQVTIQYAPRVMEERVQQRKVEQIVHVPVPRVVEEMAEVVQIIPSAYLEAYHRLNRRCASCEATPNIAHPDSAKDIGSSSSAVFDWVGRRACCDADPAGAEDSRVAPAAVHRRGGLRSRADSKLYREKKPRCLSLSSATEWWIPVVQLRTDATVQ